MNGKYTLLILNLHIKIYIPKKKNKPVANFYVGLFFLFGNTFYTPPHNSGGVLWFHIGHPCVRPSVSRPSVRSFFVSG